MKHLIRNLFIFVLLAPTFAQTMNQKSDSQKTFENTPFAFVRIPAFAQQRDAAFKFLISLAQWPIQGQLPSGINFNLDHVQLLNNHSVLVSGLGSTTRGAFNAILFNFSENSLIKEVKNELIADSIWAAQISFSDRSLSSPMLLGVGTTARQKAEAVIIDTKTNAIKHTFQLPTRSREVLLSPDASLFAVELINDSVCIFDTQKGELLHTIPNCLAPFAFSYDSKQFIASTGSWNKKYAVMLMDPRTGQIKQKITPPNCSDQCYIEAVSLDNDGSTIAIGYHAADNKNYIFLDTGRKQHTITISGSIHKMLLTSEATRLLARIGRAGFVVIHLEIMALVESLSIAQYELLKGLHRAMQDQKNGLKRSYVYANNEQWETWELLKKEVRKYNAEIIINRLEPYIKKLSEKPSNQSSSSSSSSSSISQVIPCPIDPEDPSDLNVLGFAANAKPTKPEIKKAFNQRALLCHPDKDKTQKASQRMQRINEAYNRLMNQ